MDESSVCCANSHMMKPKGTKSEKGSNATGTRCGSHFVFVCGAPNGSRQTQSHLISQMLGLQGSLRPLWAAAPSGGLPGPPCLWREEAFGASPSWQGGDLGIPPPPLGSLLLRSPAGQSPPMNLWFSRFCSFPLPRKVTGQRDGGGALE